MACFLILTKGDYGQLEFSVENFYAFAVQTSFAAAQIRLNLEIKQAGSRFGWYRVSPQELEATLGQNTLGWSGSKYDRGRNFEEHEGANITGNFRTIDDFNPETGVVTSVKTMDLSAETYRNRSEAVRDVMYNYIDALSDFPGHEQHVRGQFIAVESEKITGRVLDLGIPTEAMSYAQMDVLIDAQGYAYTKGVALIIKEVP